MTPEDLDFRYGWRWLLPVQFCRPALIVSSRIEEHAFLQGALDGTNLTGISNAAIIDADAARDSLTAMKLTLDSRTHCNFYALHGSRAAVREVANRLDLDPTVCRDYGLVPARSPRIVVPLSDRHSTLMGLGLHAPGTQAGKFAVLLLRCLATLGITRPLRKSSLLLAGPRLSPPACLLNSESEFRSMGDFALYLGAAVHARKTIALPIGESRKILKTGTHAAAREKIANEAIMLRYLGSSALASQVPKLYSYISRSDAAILVQEYVSKDAVPGFRRDRAVRDFLASAASLAPTRTTLANLATEIDVTDAGGQEVLAQLVDRSASTILPRTLKHGDFAPWNCAVSGGQLIVFDWEDGRIDGVPFDDAFSYTVYPDLLIHQSRDALEIAERALAFAQRTYDVQWPAEAIKAAFVLWCISVSRFKFTDIRTEMGRQVLQLL